MTAEVRISAISHDIAYRETGRFGNCDSKGREIGYVYVIRYEVHELDADSHRICDAEEAKALLGETFHVVFNTTHDGVARRGTSKSTENRFRTFDEALAYADGMVRHAERRTMKSTMS